MIAHTETLHTALRDVGRHEVDFFPGLQGGHAVGFAWHAGGDVPEVEQQALAELVIVGLVACIPACVHHQVGCEVALTPNGVRVLSDWDALDEGA